MSMLRTSKFVRYIGSLARNIVLNNSRNVDGLFIKRQNFVSQNYATAAAATASFRQNDNSIDRSIRRLDEDARRIGRISRRELEDVIEEIKSSRSATSTQSLMVIRCCGNLVPDETPEFRTKLVNNVWQILEKLGIPMDISHYNALLRVYLENEHKFSPTEFLAELERKGIEPNRVTYQRLIAGYCQKGDIEGATQILEFMREKQMPISEGVFNALILGHSKAGDMLSARGILGVMGQANLEPNSDTYGALLCGYASVGDAEALQSVFDECQEKEIFLGDRDYLEIVFTLAVNNHDALVDSVLTRVPRTVGYNQDASNVVLRLTTHGKENIAYKVLQTMQPPLKPDGQVASTGGFFIRQLVKSNRPVESILDICDQLKDSGLNSRGLLIATEVALQTGNTGLALDLFKAMRDNFYPIRNHYFWPLIVKKGEENRLGVLDVIKQMSEFRVSPSRETLKDYVIPYLVPSDHVENVARLIGDLQSRGTSVGASASALVFHLLSKNNIKQAAEIATTYQANYSSAAPRRVLISAYLNTNDTDSFINIINALIQGRNSIQEGEEEEDVGFDDREFVGRILQTVISRQKPFNLTELLQKMINFGLGVSNSTAEQIQSQLSGTDLLTAEVSTLLSKLVSDDLIPTPLERRTSVRRFLPRNEESLRDLIEKLKAKGDPAANIKRQLFVLFCQNKELDKAKAFFQELDAEGLVTSGTHALLIELYLQLNDLESALTQYDALLKLEPDVKLDALKTIKLATALVQADRLDDAIKFLQGQIRDDDHIEKEKSKDRPFIYSSACWRLLNTLAEKGDTEGVRKLFDVMVENKFIEPSNALLGPLVKAHLVKDDLKGALEVFEWCCQHHRSTPFKNELACKLIQNEDATELQRLTDLSTIVHGEINSLHDLIIAFVECGRIRQARKILETPGLRVRSDRLSYAGERYQNEGLVEPLEGLIKATKDISSVDRCSLYYQLLLSYKKADDVDKAVGLWTQMQEEDVQPTEEFLHELGTFLKNKNEPVPFAIPALTKVTEKTFDDTVPASKHHRNLQRSLSNKSYSDAVAEFRLLRKANATLYPTEVTGLIELSMNTVGVTESISLVKELLTNGIQIPRFKLYYFVKSLAKTGDLAAFEEFGNYLTDEQKNMTKYKNLYCNCAVEAGKTEELLNNLEEKIKKASTPAALEDITKSFPNGGVLAILDSQPDLLPRVEKLVNTFSEKGIVEPINMLWMYYLTQNEDKKAEVIFNKYLKSSPRLLFRYVQNHARKVLDESKIDNLLTYLKSWEYITNHQTGIVLSAKIDILVKKEEPEKALAIVEESLKEISIDDINYTALNRLKQSLLAKGKEFPYTIQKSSKQKQIVDESSDSDTEEISRKAAS